jgi:hypothetical protein
MTNNNETETLLKDLLEADSLAAKYKTVMSDILTRLCQSNNGSGKPTLSTLGYNDLRDMVERNLSCGFETAETCLKVGDFIKKQGLSSRDISKIGFSKIQILASFAELGWLDNEDIPVAMSSCKGRTDTELKNWLWERKLAKESDKKVPSISEGDYSEPDASIDSAAFIERNQDDIPMMILLRQVEQVYGRENVLRCLTEEMYRGLSFRGEKRPEQGMSRGGSFSSGRSPRSGKSQPPPKRPFQKKPR